MQNLLEYINAKEEDIKTYDMEFNEAVTGKYLPKNKTNYEKVCNILYSLVNIEKIEYGNVIVNWAELIDYNWAAFNEYTKIKWFKRPDDDDEYVFHWIKELDRWISNNKKYNYEEIYEFVQKLEN